MSRPELVITLPYEPPATLIADAYADTGLIASVYRSRGVQDIAGYVAVTAALSQMSSAMMQKLGEDLYAGLRKLLGRLRAGAPPDTEGTRLTDRDSGVTFDIDDKTFKDDHAWHELRELDLASLRKGTVLHWDPGSRRWRSKKFPLE
jgi:hypothetical protein